MAAQDRSLRPDVSTAEQYVSFAHFAEAHRARLEQHSAFAAWDDRIARLAETEARRQGIDTTSRSGCELYIRHFAVPIRCSFWFGWEHVVGLQRLFEQRAAERRRVGEVQVLRVAGGARRGDEERPWKNTASGLLELSESAALDGLSVRPEDITEAFQPRPGT